MEPKVIIIEATHPRYAELPALLPPDMDIPVIVIGGSDLQAMETIKHAIGIAAGPTVLVVDSVDMVTAHLSNRDIPLGRVSVAVGEDIKPLHPIEIKSFHDKMHDIVLERPKKLRFNDHPHIPKHIQKQWRRR
jgi:hypothetical protein